MEGTVNCANRDDGRPALGTNTGGEAEAGPACDETTGTATAAALDTTAFCMGTTVFASTGCATAFGFSTGLTSGCFDFFTTSFTVLDATLDAGFWILVLTAALDTALTGLLSGALGVGPLAVFFNTNSLGAALPSLEAGLAVDLAFALALTLTEALPTAFAIAFTGAFAIFLPTAFTDPIGFFLALALDSDFALAPDFTLTTAFAAGLAAGLTAITGSLDLT